MIYRLLIADLKSHVLKATGRAPAAIVIGMDDWDAACIEAATAFYGSHKLVPKTSETFLARYFDVDRVWASDRAHNIAAIWP